MSRRSARISAATHIAFVLASMAAAVLLGASWLGLVPDRARAVLEGRRALCEAVAVHVADLVTREDHAGIADVVRQTAARNPDILELYVRTADGRELAASGHEAPGIPDSDASRTRVPIDLENAPWGTVAFRFAPLTPGHLPPILADSITRLVVFVGLGVFVASALYLRRTLTHLDPSKVVPERVRTTLDTLAEGVLILDARERIVLANKAFAANVSETEQSLEGRIASALTWARHRSEERPHDFPWQVTLRDGSLVTRAPLDFKPAGKPGRTFAVNSAPIVAQGGGRRGALATFDDVTSVEEKNAELEMLLDLLRASREEIKRQNAELEKLATRDPLTGCLNRRAFFERVKESVEAARRYGQSLACIMIDIDHFKAINDTHGHAVGDHVLAGVAERLRSAGRETDVLVRFGGEEFVLLTSHTTLDEAVLVAQRLRAGIEREPCGGVPVTASMGLAGVEPGTSDLTLSISRADEALYAAKRAGRNQVVAWGALPPAQAA